MKPSFFVVLILMLVAVLVAPTNATVLTFDATPAFTDGQLIPQDYGDRVSSSPQPLTPPNYSYGDAGGWTPNVVVNYGSQYGADNFYSSHFGDLTNVLENEYEGDNQIYITFTADPGYFVRLQFFDLVAFNHVDRTVNSITVTDGSNTLYSADNELAPGSSHNTVSPNVEAQQLILTLDLPLGMYSDYVGIDNIQFSQSTVPIPGTLALLGPGLVALAVFGRRRTFKR